MTDQPTPPIGYSSWPTPTLGVPPQTGAPSADSYTPWPTRAIAWLIDSLAPGLVAAIGAVFFFAEASKEATVCMADTSEFDFGDVCVTGNQGATVAGWVVLLICVALSITFQIWNYGYRQGTTGSSIGKSVMKFQVVSGKTWGPIGFGLSTVRQVVHAVDSAICYVGYLFPLWDTKRQTFADKIMGTVCVPL
ncbi:RDD family protein [Mycobacterium sp. 236(2023)]|uniref:RDD family protein n=1 Tax=Mycobacterium sp. 236(2023) TaxID=3038163 RepID=UPI002414DCA3|nr:RDD family protein [Mycobacterium sp. 236(2023)]MDG4666010.1 RDD family protein [Mycobacterium sp. 236(2023)]